MDQLVETRESHKFSRTLKASLLMAVLVIGSVSYIPFAYAADPPITILVNTKVTSDITFSTGGFIIGADDITLDLQGHTITGPFLACAPACPGGINGIDIDGHTGVTVKNGIVEGFVFGVRLSDADNNVVKSLVVKDSTFNGISLFSGSDDNVIKGNTLEDNGSPGSGFGLIINGGTGNLVTGNTITGNAVAGVMLFSSGTRENVVKGNDISGNDNHGMFFQAGATLNVAKENTINGNGANGILMLTRFNSVLENTISGNTGRGITFGGGGSDNIIRENTISGNLDRGINIAGDRNEFIENTIVNNVGFGMFFVPPAGDNLIRENVLSGNTDVDIRDISSGAGTLGTANTYEENVCTSSIPAGLC